MQEANEKEMTFWDHLDELRKVFFRIAIAVILLACIAFLNKELLFDIVLAPQRSDFILYRFFNRLAADFSMPSLQVEDFHVAFFGCFNRHKNKCSTETYSSPIAFASSSASIRTLLRSWVR